MIVHLQCPGCKNSVTVIARTDDQFANICELHVCRNCYEKFRVVMDLLRCLGCNGQGSFHQCGVVTKFCVDRDGLVMKSFNKEPMKD
jgi:hypothetical protein